MEYYKDSVAMYNKKTLKRQMKNASWFNQTRNKYEIDKFLFY